MPDDSPQGWYADPYSRHEARRISQGTATWEVRDGDVESRDGPVPNEPLKVTPVRSEAEGPDDGSDQGRADDAQTQEPYDASEPTRAAWDVFDQSEGGTLRLDGGWGHSSVWPHDIVLGVT